MPEAAGGPRTHCRCSKKKPEKEWLKVAAGKGAAILPELGESREKAAEMFGVSLRYVSDAKRFRAEKPALFQAVLSGEKTITETEAVGSRTA